MKMTEEKFINLKNKFKNITFINLSDDSKEVILFAIVYQKYEFNGKPIPNPPEVDRILNEGDSRPQNYITVGKLERGNGILAFVFAHEDWLKVNVPSDHTGIWEFKLWGEGDTEV